ncbi:MAG: conserved membrane protein of unknown function [Nitrospira sp.]|nr:MAG: conserved membrane protein of unknown function [Nitrospira sp.]
MGGGDDKDYFTASKRTFNNVNQWFDFSQFKQTHEQAGYPLLLAWVHQLAGDSLYHRKALNVFFFLLLAQVWFAIGNQVGGRRLAFLYVYGVLLATPLWYYWIFLFKDMTIIFLQSLFILGLLRSVSHNTIVRGYGLIMISTIMTIPFRSKLAVVNLAALAGASIMRAGSRRSFMGTIMKVTVTASIILALLAVGRNPQLLGTLGVSGEHRSLDMTSMQATVEFSERSRSTQFSNVLMFPILYVIGEVAAFNPKSWEGMGGASLRGVFVIPWIYLGVPLFMNGAWMILRHKQYFAEGKYSSANTSTTNFIKPVILQRSHFLVLLMFVLIYAGVAWTSADTTRWRMPALPPMVAIAGFAWMTMNKRKRFQMLLSWGMLISISLIIYYTVLR